MWGCIIVSNNICVLNEDKICDSCQECLFCDLDQLKKCDNCCRCLDNNKKDYETITIDEIIM